MAEYTPNLNLLKKDPAVDGNDTFNIKTMLNDNWDKIDEKVGQVEEKTSSLSPADIKFPDGKTVEEKFTEVIADVDNVDQAVGNLIQEVGTLEELDTETKTNLIAAINEIYQALKTHKAEKVQHLSYATTSGTNTYNTTIDGISSLVEGMSIKVKFTNANTGASTLNVNNLGAKSIRKSNGNTLSSGNIKAGQICHLVYTGSVFQLLGEGGEYGTAQAPDVLSSRTFGTEEGIKTGTMPNNGSISKTITTQGGQISIPRGFTSGGRVQAYFTNLVASNIKKDVDIGGVIGKYEDDSELVCETIPFDLHISSGYFKSITEQLSFRPRACVVKFNYEGSAMGFCTVPWRGEIKNVYVGLTQTQTGNNAITFTFSNFDDDTGRTAKGFCYVIGS